MPNGASRYYWRELCGSTRTHWSGERESQTGVRAVTGGNWAEQEEHWMGAGHATRGFACLLEEWGHAERIDYWGQGMPNEGARDY